MEAVQFALLFGVRCPRFAAVEESADYVGVVHCPLGWGCQLWILPDAVRRVVRRPRVVAVLPMCLLISASRDRLSLMVDPRYVNWCTASSW